MWKGGGRMIVNEVERGMVGCGRRKEDSGMG